MVIYQLRKEYPGGGGAPPHVAVHSVSFVVQRNECFGLLGPNGQSVVTQWSVSGRFGHPVVNLVTQWSVVDLVTQWSIWSPSGQWSIWSPSGKFGYPVVSGRFGHPVVCGQFGDPVVDLVTQWSVVNLW